jgi:quinone-modifying oxidoreductase subunit QmoB
MERIGVFLCSGCGIGEAIDMAALQSIAGELGAAHCASHSCLCAPEGIQTIHGAINEHGLDGVLIAGCSAREKVREFQLDGPALAVERVSIREQATWSHDSGDENTQMLAEDLLRMGHARLRRVSPPKPLEETIADTVLVVGGGLTGLTAAEAAAGVGHPVLLVEKEAELGGAMRGVVGALPDSPPYDELHDNPVPPLIERVMADERVTVHTGARLTRITGQPGQFAVELETPNGPTTATVGAIVQATGAHPYDAARLPHLGYGASPNVITSNELEAMLADGKLVRPSDGRPPNRILFVQCAGSRDAEHLSYCSAECCGRSLRQVTAIHRHLPGLDTVIVHRDMRTPGQLERFYLATQIQEGTRMLRGEVERVTGNGSGPLTVHVRDTMLAPSATIEADLVVLAVGMVPTSADGEAIRALTDARHRAETGESETQRREARELAEKLAGHEGTEILNLGYRQGPDLPVLRYGFPDSHFICFPYETRRTGIYAAGTLRAPMDAAQAVEDGWGAALKAIQCIAAAKRGEAVHPRSGDLGVPEFFLQRCTQCKRCTEECPFGTLNEDAKGTPQLNPLRCRRCGICMGACPERIVSFPDYSVDTVSSMIKAISVPDEFEEKPRIVALLCENDALPALDTAAALRRKWNPWVRVIPVRCLGSTNIVWIADALSRGIDGVILIGCKYGDDYQCHYVRGSELANTRLGNVQETLNRLALEPERIRVVELSHDEFERVPEVLDEFARTIDDLGPNPMKGFE